MTDEHYLKSEIYDLVQSDRAIFDFLQEGSLDGIWYWDMTEPENEWYSQRFKELLGYQDHEVPPSSTWWREHIYSQDLAMTVDNLEKHMEDSSHPFDQIVRYRHKNGGTVWVRCRGLVIHGEDGRPIRMLGAHTDVTDLKKIEAQLIATNARLRAANQELEQFTSFASHDLKAPLRKIDSYLELLKAELEGELKGEAAFFMERIQVATEKMSTLITKLLDLSRLQTAEFKKERLDLSSLIAEIVAELGADKSSNVQITVDPLPPVLGDPALLRQVFQNLIENAIKFRKKDADSVIRISADRGDGFFQIHVRDNGMGFDPAKAEEAFQPFRRLTAKVKGSGLGLAIVQRIIAKHGGTIQVETAPNEGATFSLKLPEDEASSLDPE